MDYVASLGVCGCLWGSSARCSTSCQSVSKRPTEVHEVSTESVVRYLLATLATRRSLVRSKLSTARCTLASTTQYMHNTCSLSVCGPSQGFVWR